HPAAGDDLVPPAHEPRLGLGPKQRGRPHLRPRRRDAPLPPQLAARHRHQLAEPPIARLGLLYRRAAGRQPLAAKAAPPSPRRIGAWCCCSRPGARLTVPRRSATMRSPRVSQRTLFVLAASLLALGSPGSATDGTPRLRTERGRWTIRAERLIGR